MDRNISDFFAFIRCRHMIWYRRNVQKTPFPWTDDPILSKYKFTNVYRELDRGTKFLWSGMEIFKSLDELLWPVVNYRFINRPEPFLWLGSCALDMQSDDDVHETVECLREYAKDTKKPVFNTAYRVICNTPQGDTRLDELERTLKEFQANYPEILKKLKKAKTYEEFNKALQWIRHVGPFLAYEIATDLVNICPEVRKKFSENDWANIGPGAFVGLLNIFPEHRRKLVKEPQDLGLDLAKNLQKMQMEYLHEFPFYKNKRLSLRNIEHSLCEYGKYCNIAKGKGRARPRFTPSSHEVD